MFKSGYVVIVGRPNVGKSTLMNHLIGQKIAITSRRAQTTRNRIETVLTNDEGQIIFLDTPGMLRKAGNKLGEYLMDVSVGTLKDADVILWLVEPSDFIGAGDRQIASEIIREKALRALNEEVPHGIAVVIDTFNERSENLTAIEASIICERSSHKAIVIGKGGSMLKKIGTEARRDIEEMIGTKVFLKLFVKVRKNWRDSESDLRNFGYDRKKL